MKHSQRKPPISRRSLTLLIPAIFAAAALAGCGPQQSAEGSFDKTFTVQGPLRLELTNGSGEDHVSVGAAGQVQVHGEIHVKDWSKSSSDSRVRQLETDPPVMREGSVIRIGGFGTHTGDADIDYTVTVPPNTELKATTGSGELSATGLQGPVTILTGSGDVTLAQIGGDVRATSGSGDLTFSNIAGQTQITTGSGDITLAYPKNEVRIQTGDGDIQITQPGDAVTVQTGSGDVEVTDASADLRVHASSGEITVSGNPRSGAYWEFHAISGDITLNVPATSSFELYAHSLSGDIDTQIPIMMEGTTGSHELRGRVGDARAHVEAATTSGSITLH